MAYQDYPTIETRLEAIERRLGAIESAIGISTPAAPSKPTPAEPPSAPPTEPPTQPTVAHPERAAAPKAPPIVAPARPAPPPARAAKLPREPISLETLVGGKVFAVVGALVIVTGIALFLKLAYDLGWLQLISPAGKCLAGVAFGAMLIIAGEFALRRWSAAASAALFATGVGALYASAYASYNLYELVSPAGAFTMLVVVSTIGMAVALRARLASVAVLSLVSAYLTPVLLTSADAPAFVLPTYLLALVGVGLGLSVTHPRFRVLRSLVWWGTALLGTPWVLIEAADAPYVAVGFLTLAWLAFHGELWLSSRRGRMGTGAPLVDASRPLLVSLASTSWAVPLTAFTLHELNSPELWLAPGVAMVFTTILAMITAGHLRVLTDVPRTDEERLGACLLAQSGALFIAAIAMGVSTDWLQVAAWLVFGAAAVFAGRWIRSRALDAYGLVVLAIGLARLVLLDSWAGTMHTGGVTSAELVLTEWTLMMLIAGACWIAAGVLLLRPSAGARLQAWPIVCTLVGSVAVLASIVHPLTEHAPLALAWAAMAVAAFGAHALQRRLALDAVGVGALALSYVAWGLAYLFYGWSSSAAGWTVHPGLLVALALTLATLVAARWLVGRSTVPGSSALLACMGLGLLLASTSYEVARHVVRLTDDAATQAGAVSIWWGLFAIALLLWGVFARLAPARWAGLALLAVATAKAVVLDLAGVDPAWRVASFLGLGVLMIGVGTWYLRAIAKAPSASTGEPGTHDDESPVQPPDQAP